MATNRSDKTEDILIALDQVEQTIEVMSSVVSRLRKELHEQYQQPLLENQAGEEQQSNAILEAQTLIEEFVALGEVLH